MSYPKVLIHEGKHDNRYILVHNPTEVGPAYLAMFMAMDQHDQAYCGIEDNDETEFDMYTKAKSSIDIRVRHAAAKWLLEHRGGFGIEYENVYFQHIDTPVSLMERL